MVTTPKRHYLIPDPTGSIFPQLRDMILGVDDDVSGKVGTSFTFDEPDLWDNAYWFIQTGYHQHSSQARVVFETSATSVDISVWITIAPDSFTAIQVWVNGKLHASPGFSGSAGAYTVTQSLPVGTKYVEIVSGVQAFISGATHGTFLIGCNFNDNARMIPPKYSGTIVCYGDSTSQGGGGGGLTHNVDSSWPTHFRKISTRSLVIEAKSGLALYDDANTSTLRGQLVSRLIAPNPQVIWILIGTNDYNSSKWSSANFGTAYAALIDDLHSSLPNIKIYCQTPLLKFSEDVNSFVEIEEDYRQQIRDITATRRDWAILIEGPGFLNQAEMLSEGGLYIHPNDLGNSRIAEGVEKVLNGVIPYEQKFDSGVTEGVSWTNLTNVGLAVPNGITKNAGVDGNPDAGASSTQVISGNGPWWLEFLINETNKIRVFGVSSTNTGTDISTIRYGIAPLGSNLTYWQDGIGYTSGSPVIQATDRWRLRSDGTFVFFERIRGGIVTVMRKASTILTPSMYPLYVKGVIFNTSGTILDAKIHRIIQ